MLEVLDGRRIVHHHTHRADDILTVLRIADEFGHRVVLQHATEAYLVADAIAARDVPVSAIVVDSPGGKHEALNLSFENPGILERSGVSVAIHTDDMITSSRLFLRSGALAVRGGMSEAGALRALTLNPARMLDLGDRVGSLEPGKDADFVVLSGPPFSVRTRVLETWIEGERAFDASDPTDRLYQTGGFQVSERYPSLEGGS
jgi:imidazolonepropionase-like amidohydrolase